MHALRGIPVELVPVNGCGGWVARPSGRSPGSASATKRPTLRAIERARLLLDGSGPRPVVAGDLRRSPASLKGGEYSFPIRATEFSDSRHSIKLPRDLAWQPRPPRGNRSNPDDYARTARIARSASPVSRRHNDLALPSTLSAAMPERFRSLHGPFFWLSRSRPKGRCIAGPGRARWVMPDGLADRLGARRRHGT